MAELGETTDPKQLIPGEPGEIRKSIEHLVTYGSTLLEIGDGLKRIDTGGWSGDAADAYHRLFDNEPDRWVDAGTAFHSGAEAIRTYAGSLEWAQGQAGQAIALYEQGEQATRTAKAQHDQAEANAAHEAAAAGRPPPPTQPFADPGEALRGQAKEMLQRARDQLVSAGDQAVAVVDRAQQNAPEEPTLLDDVADTVGEFAGNVVHYGMTFAADVVDFTTNAAGAVVESAGWLAGRVVDGAGNVTGAALDAVGLDEAGRTVESSTEAAANTVTDSTRAAGDAAWNWGDDRADDIRHAARDTAETLRAYDAPSHTDPDIDAPDYIIVDEDRYPESADHVRDAQEGRVWHGDTWEERPPLPSEVTFDPAGAEANRRSALQDLPSRGADRLDRDEYPPAMMREGGAGASVQYIDSSDNRGSGASMRHQIGVLGLQTSDTVHIVAG